MMKLKEVANVGEMVSIEVCCDVIDLTYENDEISRMFVESLVFLATAIVVKLHFTEKALRVITKKSMVKNTGARGLRSKLESVLTEAMYEVCGSLLNNVAIENYHNFDICYTYLTRGIVQGGVSV
ncbi:cyclin-J18-like [Chenopodium quinoa]|uniref:cyclin-J18-like n=1 Tax=Chenopodium quinoa TaxID=63459 RepID=UPI000B788F7B|nr:cyclin-J18-like [Chenopodium quinoa]